MERQESDALCARVERLERRMRVVVAGWVLSMATFVLLGVAVQQAISQPEVLRARRIEVVDAAGRVRTVLAVLQGGGSGLGIFDAAGQQRIVLDVAPDGSPGLVLYDAAGMVRIGLLITPYGPVVRLYDAAGMVLFRAP